MEPFIDSANGPKSVRSLDLPYNVFGYLNRRSPEGRARCWDRLVAALGGESEARAYVARCILALKAAR